MAWPGELSHEQKKACPGNYPGADPHDPALLVTGMTDVRSPVIFGRPAPGRSLFPDVCDPLAAVSRVFRACAAHDIKNPVLPCHRRFHGWTCRGPERYSLHYTPFPEREIQRHFGCRRKDERLPSGCRAARVVMPAHFVDKSCPAHGARQGVCSGHCSGPRQLRPRNIRGAAGGLEFLTRTRAVAVTDAGPRGGGPALRCAQWRLLRQAGAASRG